MKVKNLVVADIMYPTIITRTMAEYDVITNNILRKVDTNLYQNIENNKTYSSREKRGFAQVDKSSIKPLSDYYYKIGLKKKNNHENKDIVYKKIKTLKKKNIKLK